MEQTQIFPHFIQAVRNWAEENGCKTFITCLTRQVNGLPPETRKKFPETITLNISSYSIQHAPQFDKDHLSVNVRFNGVGCDLSIPFDAIAEVGSPDGNVGMFNPAFTTVQAELEKASDEIIIETPKPKSKLRIVE